jgi:hypothetical protein
VASLAVGGECRQHSTAQVLSAGLVDASQDALRMDTRGGAIASPESCVANRAYSGASRYLATRAYTID